MTLSVILNACATIGPQRVQLPAEPQVLPVHVRQGTISGKDLENAITNHIKAWKYIEELKKLGAFKK